MRLSSKRNQGFTLIEIIIVVVILGILAAIALPKITSNIDKARAAEAFQAATVVNGAFTRCIDEHTGGLRVALSTDILACNTFNSLNITDPTNPSQSFGYTLNAGAATTDTLTLTIQGKFNGFAAIDNITFRFIPSTGQTVKSCNGIFIQMCKT